MALRVKRGHECCEASPVADEDDYIKYVEKHDKNHPEALRVWQQEAVQSRVKLAMPEHAMPWLEYANMCGYPRGPRYDEGIRQAWWVWRKRQIARRHSIKERPRWFTSGDQGIGHHPWGESLPCIGQRSLIYSFFYDRLLTPEDTFR